MVELLLNSEGETTSQTIDSEMFVTHRPRMNEWSIARIADEPRGNFAKPVLSGVLADAGGHEAVRNGQKDTTGTFAPVTVVTARPLAPPSKLCFPRKLSSVLKLRTDKKVLEHHWECLVLSRDRDIVSCELHSLSDPAHEPEYAELYLNQFNQYDVPLLVEGAVFYWSLGRRVKRNGQIQNISEFILRRVPTLSKSQKSEIDRKVKRLCDRANS